MFLKGERRLGETLLVAPRDTVVTGGTWIQVDLL